MCLLGDTTDELYPVYMQGTAMIIFFHLGDHERNLSEVGKCQQMKHSKKNNEHHGTCNCWHEG